MNEGSNHSFRNKGLVSKYVKAVKIITAILGLIGTLNTAILGVYIVSTYLIVSKLNAKFYAVHTYCALLITLLIMMISVVLLIYGSFLQWKMHRRGYLINALTGVAVVVAYAYLAFATPILNWLGILAVALLIPAPLSGILGVLTRNFREQ